MPDISTSPLIARTASPSPPSLYAGNQYRGSRTVLGAQMAALGNPRRWGAHTRHTSVWIIASGVIDWLLIIGTAVGGFFLGDMTPNKRPFQLENPDISFPYTVHETVSTRSLLIATVAVPVATIVIVSLFSVPGLSVPPGTPRSLIWRRKLWELYASLLSYGLGMASQWFIINGLKNMCGKPRPDLLARCQPDLLNVAQYVVGGIANITSNGQLVSANICTNADRSILDDGFRSYPSGHSSSSAAGLGHLALFLAFKFGVVFPFSGPVAPRQIASIAASAFPSRTPLTTYQRDIYELQNVGHGGLLNGDSTTSERARGSFRDVRQPHPSLDGVVFSARRAGAAPPLYLLVVVLTPFFGSVFIAASRWFNFRHHGFDILFGYGIGTVTTLVAFRMYHLPLSQGAGWAWGPRSADKAFWAGVGSNSWSEPWEHEVLGLHDDENNYESALPHSTGVSESPLPQAETAPRRRDVANNDSIDANSGGAA